MKQSNQSVRGRILQATFEILQETKNTDQISVRQIAKRANVGVGSVNYHFKSKDALICEVIAKKMSGIVSEVLNNIIAERSPRERLQEMVNKLYDFGTEHMSLVQFMIRQNLDTGDLSTALTLMPILKEIFGSDANEMHMRIMALQILLPIQVTSLAPEQFFLYSGIHIEDAEQREKFVEQLIDNLL